MTLSDSDYYPEDVGVSLDGTVAITNISSTSNGPGNILFYIPGSTKPKKVTGLMSSYYFGGFDKHGNFYNDGETSSGSVEVGVVAAGSSVDSPTGISGISFPGGIEVARDGTINIDDQKCPCIKIFKGKSHVGTVTLPGTVDPVSFALNEKNTLLWVADAGTGTVDEYRYPQGGRRIGKFRGFKTPIGVGVLPESKP